MDDLVVDDRVRIIHPSFVRAVYLLVKELPVASRVVTLLLDDLVKFKTCAEHMLGRIVVVSHGTTVRQHVERLVEDRDVTNPDAVLVLFKELQNLLGLIGFGFLVLASVGHIVDDTSEVVGICEIPHAVTHTSCCELRRQV